MMRGAPTKILKVVSVLSVAWSTLGIEIDLCTGPLAPEVGLNALCELFFPAPLVRGHHYRAARCQPGSAPVEREQPANGSHPLCGADWTSPLPVLNYRKQEARKPTLIANAHQTWFLRRSDVPGAPCDILVTRPSNLSLQLCRLLC